MRIKIRKLLVTALIMVGVRSAAATAQGTRSDSLRADSAAFRLKAILVTGARAVGVVGGASAVIMRPEELRSSPAPLLEQALRETPFVHVRQNSRGEMEMSVRGSDSRQAAVLIDGVPITLGWDHRTDPSLIPITGAQSLVIVRGLGSLLSGPNTLGGTIEVSHDDQSAEPGGRAWAGGGVDENSALVTTLGGVRRFGNALGGVLSVQGGVAYRKRDGFTLPEGAADTSSRDGLRTNSDLRHVDGFGSLRWSNARGAGLGLTVSGFDAERGVPPEEHLAAPRLWRYPYYKRMITALSGSTGRFNTPLGHTSIDVGAGYNSGSLKIETFSNRNYQTVTAQELGEERTFNGRVLLTHSLPANALLRAAFTTADVRYTETLTAGVDDKYRQKLWSAGGEIEAPLGAGTTLAGGLVYDKTETPETGGRTPAQEPFNSIGWRAGLMHDLTAGLRLHASASQRSRFPALRELYSGALNRFMPNPELEPETLLGFEAGIGVARALGPIPQATFEVTGFHHNLDNAVVRITLPAPDRRFRRINRDRIESTGAEVLAGFAFSADRERAVTLNFDVLFQKISIFDITLQNEPERHAENNPETRGSLELSVPLPLSLRLSANSRYTGTQYCLNADSGNEMELRSQAEHDLVLERSFTVGRGAFRSLRALVAMDNLADATVFDQCGLTQPGRTLRLMFSLR
ncbi:MAG: TonB-dependent receptor plug domain-containing protein [Longimicrobiales bacterium]